MTSISLIFTFLASFVFIKLMIRYAQPLGLIDIPNERSQHKNAIPKSAGIGFTLAFFLSNIIFFPDLFQEYWYLYVSIFIVFLMGIVDDRYDVKPKMKFLAIFVAVIFLSFYDIGIYHLGRWFGIEITLPYLLGLFFTMFALAGFTNALNLIDGIDGLSGSVSIVIIAVFGVIGFNNNDQLMMILSLTMIASLLAFMLLNWNPAKIFMGDSGSLTLGFFISLLAVLSTEYIHPIAILYLAAIPILDTLIVMTRRIRRGISPFSPDKTHIHHILVDFFGNNVKKTVFFLILLQLIFTMIGYMLVDIIQHYHGYFIPSISLLFFGMLFVIFYMIFTGIKRRQKIYNKKISRMKTTTKK